MKTPAERLREARIAAGFESAPAAAEAMGVPGPTYMGHENGSRGFQNRIDQYARRFGVEPEWIMWGRGEGPKGATRDDGMMPITRWAPVVGEVRAGAWAEIPDDEPEPEEFLPIALPGYERATLYVLRVAGRSMDQYYPDGSRVIVCPAVEIGVREGDHVVVRRRRGMLVETTLKEVVQETDGISLWPRSTDPAYQTPFRLKTARDADEGPEIIAVVVAVYSVRPMPSKPLIQL